MAKRRLANPHGRVLRLPEVIQFTGLRRTQLLTHVERGDFPAPIKLTSSGRAIGWLEDELIAWRESRIASRNAKGDVR